MSPIARCRKIRALLGIIAVLAQQFPAQAAPKSDADVQPWRVDPYPSTYVPGKSNRVAITNATILTATGAQIDRGTVLIEDNRIRAVGADVAVPSGWKVIDANAKWVTPGLIDAHTHVGEVSIPVGNLADGINETSDPNTAQIFVEHDLWPQSPDFPRVRAAGVTTAQVLPGSASIFGGRTVILKLVPAVTIQDMKFPGASYGLKMACGENPTRQFGEKEQSPMTRAALIATMRNVFREAQEYSESWPDQAKKGRGSKDAEPPKRNYQLETIAGVEAGDIRLNVHCYRAEDMANVLAVTKEFGIKVTSFHHATEAFKIVPLLKQAGPCVLTWGGPDWGGFKMEAYDHTALSVAMLDRAGVCVAVTSDSSETMQHLNIDAARSLAAGQRAGLSLTRADAIRWITLNPARALGIDQQTGSIEPGKMADIVLWSGDPFSSFSHTERVWIDGVELFARGEASERPSSDFDIGLTRSGGAQ